MPLGLSSHRLIPLLAAGCIGLLGLSTGWTVRAEEGFLVTNENAAIYQRIPEVENQLYGHAYPSQAISQRVSRIERTLFGSGQRGPLETRIQGIEARMNEKNSRQALAQDEPMLAYLEEKLFQRTYEDKPLPERMHQLEMQVFGRSYDSYPAAVRLKKLTYAMPIMAKEIRLTKGGPDGDMVIASASRVSQRQPRSSRPTEMVELNAMSSGPVRTLPNGAPLSSGDYFQVVHHTPGGEMMRWTTLPIKVFIKPAPESLMSAKVLQVWQNSFSVQPTGNPLEADVIVSWDKPDWDQNTMGLLVRPVVHMDINRNIRTIVLLTMYPVRGYAPQNEQHVLAHALGHAFGLWGHSDDPADVMYPALRLEMQDYPARWSYRSASVMDRVQPVGMAQGFQPSQRDINTLLKVYDQPGSDLSTFNPY